MLHGTCLIWLLLTFSRVETDANTLDVKGMNMDQELKDNK